MKPLRSVALALALGCLGAGPAHANRRLSLAQAVDLAMSLDPLVAESHIQHDRSKLGVLRAQLDRVSLKVDAQVQELWNKQNILGPTVPPYCTIGVLTDEATCAAAGQTWVASPDQSPSAGQGLLSLSANLNVPLFTGFRISSNVKRSELQREAALVAIRQSRHDTALAVARAYWSVRRQEILSAVQAASLDRLREAEGVTDGRLRAGLAPPIDFNRAHLRRVQQEALLADLRGQAEEAMVQLAVALGLSEPLLLTDEPAIPDGVPPAVVDLIADARHVRPEVQTARLQLEMQAQTVRIARSTYYPQLAAFGLFQYGNNPYQLGVGARSASSSANPFASLSGNLTLGAALSVNLFDSLSTWSTTRDARYEEARLAEEGRRLSRIVESDVRMAHARILHLQGRRMPLLQAAEIARDNAAILEARYKNGDALVIEFLDAQIERANVELTLADVTAQLQLAWIELEAALGKTVGVDQ